MATLPHDDVYQLVRAPIDMAALARLVRAPEDGAVVTFDGFVRNQSHNRTTLYLDYEAYESMALSKMREIGMQIHEKYRIHRVAMVHRLGRLEIGETSVFIAVSAPHRAAAFDACRFAIDTLKRTVPIWKKEYFEDGAVWADGELPPAPAMITAKRVRTRTDAPQDCSRRPEKALRFPFPRKLEFPELLTMMDLVADMVILRLGPARPLLCASSRRNPEAFPAPIAAEAGHESRHALCRAEPWLEEIFRAA